MAKPNLRISAGYDPTSTGYFIQFELIGTQISPLQKVIPVYANIFSAKQPLDFLETLKKECEHYASLETTPLQFEDIEIEKQEDCTGELAVACLAAKSILEGTESSFRKDKKIRKLESDLRGERAFINQIVPRRIDPPYLDSRGKF